MINLSGIFGYIQFMSIYIGLFSDNFDGGICDIPVKVKSVVGGLPCFFGPSPIVRFIVPMFLHQTPKKCRWLDIPCLSKTIHCTLR